MEDCTDWGMRRKGAFRDLLKATERCLAVGISDRSVNSSRYRTALAAVSDKTVSQRAGRVYEADNGVQHIKLFYRRYFAGGLWNEIENERLEKVDLRYIPDEMTALSRDSISMLGRPECDLLGELLLDNTPPNVSANFPCVSVDADYNVYPNIAEPTKWWCLGNLKTDGVGTILKAYFDGTMPGMVANKTIPVSELAQQYGNPDSTKLYARDDLVCRFLHQWGEDYMGGNL